MIRYNKLLKIPTNTNIKMPKKAKLAIHDNTVYSYFDNKILAIKLP